MAIGDLVTADWEFEFNGYAFGNDDNLEVLEVQGLIDLPDLRSSDLALLRQDGLHPGDDFLVSRTVNIGFSVTADDEAGFTTEVDDLLAMTAPGAAETPLVFQLPGVAGGFKSFLWARPRRRVVPLDQRFYHLHPEGALQFVATDPRIYRFTPVEQTAFPGGSATVNNAGSFRTSNWNFTVTGPGGGLENPTLTHDDTGEHLGLNYTVASGETITVDVRNRTLTSSTGDNLFPYMTATSTWFELAPGDNVLNATADSGSAALFITSYSAYV